MCQPYSELVLSTPFLLCKGFLMGFMNGRGEQFNYFFPRKKSVRKESIGELIREALDLDCHTHLCLPNYVLETFKNSVRQAEPVIGMKIESEREIDGCEFSFSFHIYNEQQARQCKKLFTLSDDKVTLENYQPEEKRQENLVGIQEYAPIHPYVFEGHGTAKGEFEDLAKFYLTLKKSDISNFILCSELRYALREAV